MKYENWKDIPEKPVWDILKPYVGWPAGTTDFNTPPMYGHIVDQLRIQHGIYIAVVPLVEYGSDNNPKNVALRFRGSCVVMNGGLPAAEYVFSDVVFYDVMRKVLKWAGEWLQENKK